MGKRYQYCKTHEVVEDYPACDIGTHNSFRFSKNQQLAADERPVVWEHPGTGEIRYPGRNDCDMPKYYKDLGYQRKEITSYKAHQQFCDERGLINHKAEGIRDEVLNK